MILDPRPENIYYAIETLKNGELIGLPTETVYGLAGDATNPSAITKIFARKNRPNFNPLISHVTSLEMAMEYGVFNENAIKLSKAFWPGPFTIIVPRSENCEVSDLACAGLETIALRMPKHEIAQEIISKFGKPIAAPSANLSGSISPTSSEDVFQELGDLTIINGGKCEIGLESTVVLVLNEVTLLRHGSVSIEQIETILGEKVWVADKDDESPKSPGMLLRHYSPKAKLYLNQASKQNDEILIGFGEMDCDFNLSTTSNLNEAATNLYSFMRKADALTPNAINIAPIPCTGIGIAINDRLMRAAN